MEDMRRRLRWTATAIASVLAAIFIVPLASEFVIEIAREQGLFKHPTATLEAAMNWLSSIGQSWWFALFLGFFVGATAAFWIGEWFPRRTPASLSSDNDFVLTHLTRIYAVGKNLVTRIVKTAEQLNQWNALYEHWNTECNDFVTNNVSSYEGIEMRYITVEKPSRFDDSFSDEHNRSRNVIQEKLKRLNSLIQHYSSK
jgi:hypothetical protein